MKRKSSSYSPTPTETPTPASASACLPGKIITERAFYDRINPLAGDGQQYPGQYIKNMIRAGGDRYLVFDPAARSNTELIPEATDDSCEDRACYTFDFMQRLADGGRLYSDKIQDGTVVGAANFFRFYLGVSIDGKRDVLIRVNYPLLRNAKGAEVIGTSTDVYFSPNSPNTAAAAKLTAAVMADEGGSCADTDPNGYCAQVAIRHSISQVEFQKYLAQFWQDNPVPPAYYISWSVMRVMINDNCDSGKRFQFMWDEQGYSDNHLEIAVVADPDADDEEKEAPPELVGDLAMSDPVIRENFYSFPLMRGINQLNPVGQMRLYKGQMGADFYTILIESIGLDGNRHYYDISNEHP